VTLGNDLSTSVVLTSFQGQHAAFMLLGPITMERLLGRERVRAQWDRVQVFVLLPSGSVTG